MCLYNMFLKSQWKAEDVVTSIINATDSYEPPCGCCNFSLYPLEEPSQPTFLVSFLNLTTYPDHIVHLIIQKFCMSQTLFFPSPATPPTPVFTVSLNRLHTRVAQFSLEIPLCLTWRTQMDCSLSAPSPTTFSALFFLEILLSCTGTKKSSSYLT